ncbi:diguanylate cyclase domain-containing protein [Zoogloea dura]|jgi:diguanylate cyclase (GGDEF)-like protein|uniref:Sensor domain-containing diguanylate cyclase n=1 Tax=Zoogloea dura TaxID=2728840 RepID=A0A848G0N4_9RHOO|nr:diguanylate cyclase [Zoogloea dura]NML24610.1 sensor domain-containing diguanylate cyclase [Zoogloea dura]
MSSRRTRPQSYRPTLLLWALTVVFCIAEAGILFLAYRHTLEYRQLSTQLGLVQQGSALAYQLSAGPATPVLNPSNDPRQRWLTGLLSGLLAGGTSLHSLENIRVAVGPVEGQEARRILAELNSRWSALTSQTLLSTLSQDAAADLDAEHHASRLAAELAAIGPGMGHLAMQLARQRDEAMRQADLFAVLAVATGLLACLVVGTLLLLQRRRSERSGRLMRSMMNQIGAGVCILGSTDKIADANRAACRMLGRPRKALRGRRLDEILSLNDGVWTGERPDGLPLAIERIPGVIEGYKGPLRIMTLLDVTARHLTNECLQHLANHDPLTGLPNRGFLAPHFERELQRCEENKSVLGVAVLDLDGFKPINDTYGHAIGDELLVQISQRLGAALRNGDVIARIGGDEFAGVFPDINNRDTLNFLGERLLGIFAHPFHIQGQLITIGGSIGLALAPDDGLDQDSLLKAADAAMYRAKHDGRPALRLASRTGDSVAA